MIIHYYKISIPLFSRIQAINELRNGELLEDDKNITVSPR